MNLSDFPHRRYNPLTGEWTLVSCHRTKRPWQGRSEMPLPKTVSAYDPKCALCPGNLRAGNQKNPEYDGIFQFDNDFPALLPDIPVDSMNERGLLVAEGEQGRCRIVCYSPLHDVSISLMSTSGVRAVVDAWETEFRELSAAPGVEYVSIFENRGDLLGAFNTHPHCQIWAHATTPTYPAIESVRQREYLDKHKSCLLCSYAELELEMKSRIIAANDLFIAVLPFWASWPYEVLIVPRIHVADISGFSSDQRAACAAILQSVTTRFDNLHSSPFPYAMAVHQKPVGNSASSEEWHFHIHFVPPLARNGISRKFHGAYEMLFMTKRDNTPEEIARKLRTCSDVHYSKQSKEPRP